LYVSRSCFNYYCLLYDI